MSKAAAAAVGTAVLTAAWALATPSGVHAQYLDPRTAQAMAVCNSPAGALLTECRQLNALATLGAVPGVPGAQTPEALAARQQVYRMCVAQAAGNPARMNACNQGLGPVAGADAGTNTALAIAQGGARYQACVSALMAQGGAAGGINPCTPLLNGQPAGPGAPAGFGPTGAANPPAPVVPVQPQRAPVDPLGF